MTIREPELPASKENRKPLRVLLVEDSVADAELALRELKKAGFEVSADVVEIPEDFAERLRSKTYDIVLSDQKLPGWSGMEALEILRQQGKDIPFVLVSGSLGEDAAVECIKKGASDYVLKDRIARLQVAVRRALEETALRDEAKQIEEERRQAEKRFRDLIEYAPDAVVVINEQDEIVLVNAKLRKMFGYEGDELIGQTVDALLPEQFRNRLAVHRRSHLADPHFRSTGDGLELWALAKDGREIPVEIALSPLEAAEGLLISVAIRDMTERRRAEEKLRESEAAFQGLFEFAPDAIVLVNDGGRITLVNAHAENIFGYTREELIGQPIEILLPERHSQKHIGYRTSFHANPTNRSMGVGLELFGLRKDGAEIPVEVDLSPLKTNEGTAILSIIRDVSERKRLDLQFTQSQKFEAIGRLAGGVAHDFNNHLGIILGYSELLLDRLAPEDSMHKNARMIKDAALKAASLTKQLLAFSRRQVLEPRVLDLNTNISELSKMLQPLLGEDIELTTRLEPALGQVKADPTQIDQVIMNLAVNARDAMPQGGKLTIETANVELDEGYARLHVGVQPGSFVVLVVSDTGIGMDKDTQAHIFEPFFTTKEKGKGTGLGLATLYGIVKQSSGNVWVYSEPGQGTTFKIYLPRLQSGTEAGAAEKIQSSAPKGSETVLTVEDVEILRMLACEFLKSGGYTVLEASNGTEAIEISNRHQGPIRLLMTDAIMPGMSGRELAERLQALRPEMEVLYVSGYTDDAILRNGLSIPGTAFLQKPYTRDALMRKVREVLERERGKE